MTTPKGWLEATIGDVAGIRIEKLDPAKLGDLPFVGLEHIEAHTGRLLGQATARNVRSSVSSFRKGDILFGRLRPYLNKVIEVSFDGCASAEVVPFEPRDGIIPSLLKRIMMSEDFLEFTASLDRGDRPRIKGEDVCRYRLLLPPTAEQRRIVAKLDSLIARIARAKAELDRVQALAGGMRDTALKLTFERPGQHVVELRQVLADVRYGTAKKCDYGAGVTPVLRIPNVQAGRIDTSDLKSANFNAEELSKLALDIGDVLVIRSNGSLDLVGKSAVVNASSAGFLYAGYLIRLRPNREKVLPEYLNYFLGSPQTRQTIENAARSTSGVNNVNAQQLQALTIPLPTVTEQGLRVGALDATFTRAARLEAEAARARELLDRLESAILAKAFRGELVPQDPHDEPASVLLERIRTQRVAAPKPKRGV